MKTDISVAEEVKEERVGSSGWSGLFLLLGLLLFGGCGDRDETATVPEDSTKTAEEGNPLTAPVDYLGAVNQAQKSSARKLNLMGIQQAIQQFQVVEDRLPRSLQEVVSSGYIARLPDLPKGQSLRYDPRTGVVSQVQSESAAVE